MGNSKRKCKYCGEYVSDWITVPAGTFCSMDHALEFANMEQEEFEQFAVAVQNAAMRTLFKGADEQTIQRLYSFF